MQSNGTITQLYHEKMKTISNAALYFCVIASVCFITVSCSEEGNYLVAPEYTTALEGDQVALSCTLRTSNAFLSSTPFWETGLSSVVTPSRYIDINSTSNGTSKIITSQIIFYSVGREMDSYYRCSILVTFDGTRKVFLSSFGKLTVQFFPRDGELRCRGPRSPILTEGSDAIFACEGIQCHPPILLEWDKQESDVFGINSTFSANDTLLTGLVKVTRFLNDKVLHCFAKSDAFPGRSINCTIGPLNVHFAPAVQVFPLINNELRPPLVVQSELTCVAEGNPSIVTYDWSCQPTALISECKANGNNLTLALSASFKEASTLNITCEAINSVGSSLNSLQINVTTMPIEKTLFCSRPFSTDLSDAQDLYIGFDQRHGKALTCLALVMQIDPVFFRWYMNGYLVSEGSGIHDFLELQNGNRQLIVEDTFESTRNGMVTCEMLSGAIVKRAYCMLETIDSTDVTTEGISVWETENDKTSPTTTSYGNPEETFIVSEDTGPSQMFLMVLIASIIGSALLFGSVLIAVFLFRASRLRNNLPPGHLQLSTLDSMTRGGHGSSPKHVCAGKDPLYDSISEGENISTLRGLTDRSLEYAANIVKSREPRQDTSSSDEAPSMPSSIDQIPVEGELRATASISSSESEANDIIYQNTHAMPQVHGVGKSPYFWSKVNQ